MILGATTKTERSKRLYFKDLFAKHNALSVIARWARTVGASANDTRENVTIFAGSQSEGEITGF